MDDHALRYALANELHARPFPSIKAPGRAVHLAIKQPSLAAVRDRDLDRAHLIDLLDRFGAQHPSPGATHYFGEIGANVIVRRNDALDVQQAMAMKADAIVLSPGPCDPAQAGPTRRRTVLSPKAPCKTSSPSK